MTFNCFRTALFSLFASVGLASAAAVNLSGAVYDKDNKPVPGVIVSLSHAGLSDTTGADGMWTISDGPVGIRRVSTTPMAMARWDGSSLHLELIAPATVQLDAFDVRGVRIGKLAAVQLEAGSHLIPVSKTRAANGMSWMRLKVNDETQLIGTRGTAKLHQVVPSSLARTQSDSVEEIVYTLQGQLITIDTVTKLIQSGLEKWIQEFSVSGKVAADSRVTVDTVLAWFDGGRMSGLRRGRMGFNKQNAAYSGRIYTVKSITGDVFDYRVWINVMGNGNKRTGISDTTDFSSDYGAIDFIPLFSVANAIPNGSIVGPSAGLVNTDFSYSLALTRADERIAHFEWDEGEAAGFVAGTDKHVKKWLQPGTYNLQVRLTDIDSNTAVLSKTVNISNQASTLAGIRDTVITPSDVVVFSINAVDTDGVAKVLWDFGDGKRDSSFGGPVHTVSHKYPGTDSVKVSASRAYPLTVTVVDLLGNRTNSTAVITVVNDIPVAIVNDTAAEPDSLVTLHARFVDRGTIVKYEWSLDGTTFKTGGKDTTLKMPSKPTVNYPVYLRLTDEDGNLSPIDTIKVIVTDMMTDVRDGQRYRIVKIGSQVWMAQNLNIKTDSSWLPTYGYNYSMPGMGMAVDTATSRDWGRLYNWATAMGLDDSCTKSGCQDQIKAQHRGVCPAGWHIPSAAEWSLISILDQTKLKAGTSWNSSANSTPTGSVTVSGNGSNAYGFGAMAAGERNWMGNYSNRGSYAGWWSTAPYNSNQSGSISNGYQITYNGSYEPYALKSVSVRCIQDTLGVAIQDTSVETGAKFRVHAEARGKAGAAITSYEWSVDGGTFSSGTADLDMTAPSAANPNYRILVRVTDANGNVSAVDTAKVSVLDYFTDARDGQRYPFVKIGKQTWMARNLNFKVDSSWSYAELGRTMPQAYGRIYNWAAAFSIPDSCSVGKCKDQIRPQHRGVCPSGWHMPSSADWNQLMAYKTNMQARLKSTSGWNSSYGYTGTGYAYTDQNGLDEFGFNALPGGNRGATMMNTGLFNLNDIGNVAYWWDAPDYMGGTTYQINGASSSGYNINGANLRCLQDTLAVSLFTHDTAVPPGSSVILKAEGHGKAGAAIVSYEWSVNGSPFTAGPSTSAFAMPSEATARYVIKVRVQDADGNVSSSDSASIWVGTLMTDARDGNVYKTIKIGNQTWMAQNLNYKTDSSSIYYSEDSAKKYGRSYSWIIALGLDDSCRTGSCSTYVASTRLRGLCPSGWHIPSTIEWDTLFNAVGGSAVAAGKLKSIAGWSNSMMGTNPGGSDDYGFAAQPAGYGQMGSIYAFGSRAQWWAASGNNAATSWSVFFDSYGVYASKNNSYYVYLQTSSVRCVLDP